MRSVLATLFAAIVLAGATPAAAHCDALDGPVIADARVALSRGDVTPVLKWAGVRAESEIRAAFARALRARASDDAAREVADQWFFETLVRLHRAGEGATFEGLKPTGWKPPEAVAKADEAMAKGNIESLEALLETALRTELRERFRVLLRARELRNDSVDAGRRYVDAYTDFMHYVERLAVSPHAGEDHHDH